MGTVFLVTEVILEDRLDCCPERLENTEVRIGPYDYNRVDVLNPLCFFLDTRPTTATSVYTCTEGPMEGRFAMVRKVGQSNPGEWAWHIRVFRVFVVGSPNSEYYPIKSSRQA